MKRKKITIIALLLAMMFMLCGCIQMVLELELKEDMSAEFDMKVGMLNEYSELMEEMKADMWADYDEMSKLGYTLATYEKDGYTGVEITGNIKDITKENNIAENFFNDSQIVFISYKEEDGKKLVALDLPVESFSGVAESEIGMPIEDISGYAKSDIRLIVTFPFDVVEHNATDVSGRTLTWDLSKMTDDNMYAVAEGRDDGVAAGVGSKLVRGLLLGLGALAIAGIVILILSMAGKKKRANNISNISNGESTRVYDYNANSQARDE